MEQIPFDKKSTEIVENVFIFALMWAFGGPMIVDKSGDYRKKFSDETAILFANRFPKEAQCFDYVWDFEEDAWVEWSTRVPSYTPQRGHPSLPRASAIEDGRRWPGTGNPPSHRSGEAHRV